MSRIEWKLSMSQTDDTVARRTGLAKVFELAAFYGGAAAAVASTMTKSTASHSECVWAMGVGFGLAYVVRCARS
jgi:hypothetical protein